VQFSLVDWRLEAPWFACANSWVWLSQSRPAAVVVLPSLEILVAVLRDRSSASLSLAAAPKSQS